MGGLAPQSTVSSCSGDMNVPCAKELPHLQEIQKSGVLSGKLLEQGPSPVLGYLFSKLQRPASFPARCATQNHLKQDTFLSCLSL